MARDVGGVVGVDVSVRAKLEPLRSKLVGLVDRGWMRKLPDGRFTPAHDQEHRHSAPLGTGVTRLPPAAVGIV
ncbi:hypothetical protein ACFVZR_26025 [Streptomyces sp. NPDC058316]|uniref:hypothetical protein n=1 Tax=unclassified Streptomyces TaxID=2593676 RepID=UPI00331C2AAC